MTGRRITLIVAGPRSPALAATAGATKPTGADDGTEPRVLREPGARPRERDPADQKDARSAVPPGAYHQVQLTNLDGSGFLQGQYVKVATTRGRRRTPPPRTIASSATRASSSR